MCVCVYLSIYIHIHNVYTYANTHTHTHVYINIYTHACIYINILYISIYDTLLIYKNIPPGWSERATAATPRSVTLLPLKSRCVRLTKKKSSKVILDIEFQPKKSLTFENLCLASTSNPPCSNADVPASPMKFCLCIVKLKKKSNYKTARPTQRTHSKCTGCIQQNVHGAQTFQKFRLSPRYTRLLQVHFPRTTSHVHFPRTTPLHHPRSSQKSAP